MTDIKSIGLKIKELRKNAEMTQTELGVGLFPEKSPTSALNIVKNIETGRRQLKPSELAKILKIVGSDEVEFHELNSTKADLHSAQYPDFGPEARKLFPEIDYYYNMFNDASRAGDSKLAHQVLKAMTAKLGEKIEEEERREGQAKKLKKA